jgi:hypothetical protein
MGHLSTNCGLVTNSLGRSSFTKVSRASDNSGEEVVLHVVHYRCQGAGIQRTEPVCQRVMGADWPSGGMSASTPTTVWWLPPWKPSGTTSGRRESLRLTPTQGHADPQRDSRRVRRAPADGEGSGPRAVSLFRLSTTTRTSVSTRRPNRWPRSPALDAASRSPKGAQGQRRKCSAAPRCPSDPPRACWPPRYSACRRPWPAMPSWLFSTFRSLDPRRAGPDPRRGRTVNYH